MSADSSDVKVVERWVENSVLTLADEMAGSKAGKRAAESELTLERK